MKRIEIRHSTRYGFAAPVTLGAHTLLLRPREGHDLRIASSSLDISPEANVTWRRDFYDNVLAVANFADGTVTEVSFESRLEVELYEITPLDFVVDPHAVQFPIDYSKEEQTALRPFLETVYDRHDLTDEWIAPYTQMNKGTETFFVLDQMNHRINEEIVYEERDEPGVLAPETLLEIRKGSCRDMAALFVEACRRLNIAARFVSGYVHGPATEAGGASSHAWAEVYLPGAGWKGFDPTNIAVVGPDHIPVAVHRHPEKVPPVAGSFTGPNDLVPTLTVDVQIHEILEPV
ncbi:transglutaminase family protein [Thiosocius teredinicola]|uniref:transglutaminase family protein n=1 Tax=Thiosocius teredinicola TaxID=1973002 RepID=UPI000991317C